jgi:hypothetical protein
MNPRALLSIALLMGTLAAVRADEFFVEPIVSSVNPHVVANVKGTGLGLCGGKFFGTDEIGVEKEISFQFDRVKFTTSGMASAQHYDSSETLMPVVVNLRANFAPDSRYRKLRMYIGPCIGAARVATNIGYTGGGAPSQYGSSTDWDLVYGGSIGLMFRFDNRAHLDIGYRILGTTSTKISLPRESYATGNYTVESWYMGVGVRF